jgi:Fe2+ or Zn2+ uptake regulation protein
MSFEEFEDAFVWRCDDCGLVAEFPPRDFWRCKDEIKARGWRFEREEGTWWHKCARCAKKNENAANVLDRPIKRRSGVIELKRKV